jgi:hypothetical protein
MTKKSILSFILFLSLNCAFSQNLAKDTVEIRRVLTDFFEVFSNPDMKYFDNNCVPGFELYDMGEIWNRDSVALYVKNIQSKPKDWTRTNRFEFIKFNFRKNIAWVSYHNYATIVNSKKNTTRQIHWLESMILEKIKGRWVLVQMHSTLVK